MKSKYIFALTLLCVFLFSMLYAGCTYTLTTNDSLQINLTIPAEKTELLVSEFEQGEENSVAGDVTQKAGSVCVGGACIIY